MREDDRVLVGECGSRRGIATGQRPDCHAAQHEEYQSCGRAESSQPVPAEKLAGSVQPARRRDQHGPVLHVPLDIGCEV